MVADGGCVSIAPELRFCGKFQSVQRPVRGTMTVQDQRTSRPSITPSRETIPQAMLDGWRWILLGRFVGRLHKPFSITLGHTRVLGDRHNNRRRPLVDGINNIFHWHAGTGAAIAASPCALAPASQVLTKVCYYCRYALACDSSGSQMEIAWSMVFPIFCQQPALGVVQRKTTYKESQCVCVLEVARGGTG